MSRSDDNALYTRNVLAAIRELDVAVSHHINWLKRLHTALITNLAPTAEDLSPEAHRLCEFGNWFYGEGARFDLEQSAFDHIESVHQSMHDAARLLLGHRTQERSIDVHEYERFMDLAIQFKQAVRAFQYAMINRVCTVDHLTGAWNRHAMAMKLAEESERTQRSGQCCALCMMDIDHFKRVNDQYGHKVGDEVLQAFTSIISAELRKYDTLFRYGGEEFLMLLPNTNLENAAILLNRIRETVAVTPIHASGGVTLVLTASFGVSQLACNEVIEDALEHADHALLAAKAGGRNKVCVWDVPPASAIA